MKYKLPLIVVKDMERSRRFYEDLLGQKVILDFGENITFAGDFCLQTIESWRRFIGDCEDTVMFRPNNFELYFEEKNFEQFMQKLQSYDGVDMIHDAREYPWGQSVVRFYDPDKHIIEVGESMAGVVRRFHAQGITISEIVARTQHPVEFVTNALNERVQKKLTSVRRHD